MHCQSCGQKLRSKARFCNNCGKSIVERFGSALLVTPPPMVDDAVPETPTENLSPKVRTARNQAAPSTLENQAMLSTDQLGLRGTGRQALPKITSEEAAPKLAPPESRTTVVEAKAFKEAAPTRAATVTDLPAPLPVPLPAPLPALDAAAATPAAPAFVPPPPVALAPPPKPAPPVAPQPVQAPAEVEYITPSTQELQQSLANKPFFTRMLTPKAQNQQHRYLIFAVPLVLLAALIVLIVFLWLR